jgi:23S rRNA (uridine2552-2'-O)-methyltransferase
VPRRFETERRRDPYYRAAQREGLRSRAAYKLAYLDDRFRLFRPNSRVLDLGAAPGGWSTVARRRVGPRGEVVAVDPRPLEPIEGVRTVRGRVGDPALAARLGPGRYDVVLSDMSPRISGAYATDHARSVALVRDALGLAREVLEPGGTFVAKVFAGDLLDDLAEELSRSFERVRRTKPPASREPSSELYLLAFGFAGPAAPRAPEREPPPLRASDI